MHLLISVRTVEEALLAARSGADFIDLKEPRRGALGGLPVETIRDIVGALRRAESGVADPTISATIGDLPMSALGEIQARVAAVAACGVDLVKVGILPGPGADRVLQALAGSGVPVVPLFIADGGLQGGRFDALLARVLAQRFFAVMVDTADKAAGSLFDLVPLQQLRQFVAQTRAAGVRVGLAGALRQSHLPELAQLQPSFVGFRGAVCEQTDRSAELSGPRVVALRAALLAAQRAAESVALSG